MLKKALAEVVARPIITQEEARMAARGSFSAAEARQYGEVLGIGWDRFNVDQFRRGMDVELEHGARDPHTDVSHDDPLTTAKIALAHLNEFPDYYDRLEKMEHEAETAWECLLGMGR